MYLIIGLVVLAVGLYVYKWFKAIDDQEDWH